MRSFARAVTTAVGVVVAWGMVTVPAAGRGDRVGGPWRPPVDLSPVGNFSTRDPAVAAGPDGSFVAVWQRALPDRPARDRVIEARRIDRQGALGPLLVLTPTDGEVENAHVTIGADGRAVAIWHRIVAPLQIALEARQIGSDGALGPLITVSDPGERALSSAVVVGPAGDATIAWNHQLDDFRAVLRVRRLAADGSLGPVFTLTPADEQVQEVAVTIDRGARPLVVWNQHGVIQAQRLFPTGEPMPDMLVLSPEDDTSAQLSVGMDARGVARVAWARFSGSEHIVVVTRTIAPDGTLGAPQDVSPANQSSVSPRLAVNEAGASAVVWQWNTPGIEPEFVQGCAISETGVLSPVLTLSGPSISGANMLPVVGIDARGMATAVWQRSLGDTGVVDAARFAFPGIRGVTTTLSEPASEQPLPAVAVTAEGRALAVWGQETSDGNGVRIQAARSVFPPALAHRRHKGPLSELPRTR